MLLPHASMSGSTAWWWHLLQTGDAFLYAPGVPGCSITSAAACKTSCSGNLASLMMALTLSPPPLSALCLQITEPYLQIYRGILPPLFGQLDFTPLFGFLILQVSARLA
jgi:hypothetical protein